MAGFFISLTQTRGQLVIVLLLNDRHQFMNTGLSKARLFDQYHSFGDHIIAGFQAINIDPA